MSGRSTSPRRRRRHRSATPSTPGTPAKSPSSRFSKPTTVAYLEQLTLEMTASKVKVRHKHGKSVRYELVVTGNGCDAPRWHVSRSFRELAVFQQKLLAAMKLGHFCHAQCPYLYSALKDRFPKECYLYSSSTFLMEKRRSAMEDCFTKLLLALVDHDNYASCAVLAEAVALEFIRFLTVDLPVGHEHRWENFTPICRTPGSNSTLYSTDSTRSLTPTSLSGRCWQAGSSEALDLLRSTDASTVALNLCPLCEARDETEATTTDALTTLRCGHQFHDECIVAKLNEALQCPTCGHDLAN